MLYFIAIYFVFLYGLALSREIIFFNEEVLIAACMIIVFFFLIRALRKMVNFIFFFRVESIYFSFLYLVLLNIKLIEKMLNLVKLENLRLESLLIFQLYSHLYEFSNEVLVSAKNLNLIFVKNFIFSFVSNLYILNFFSTSSNFLVNISNNSSTLITTFTLSDNANFFSIPRISTPELLKELSVTELYEIYTNNVSEVIENSSTINPDTYFLSDF